MTATEGNNLLQAPEPLTDIGVNLTSNRFDNCRNEIIEQAVSSGITRMILTGTSVKESEAASTLCQQYPENLWFTAGVHPHDASQFDKSTPAALKDLAMETACVAIGEAGLDFNRNFSTSEQQISAFEAQIELAIETGKPMFLHEREAFERQHEMLRYYRDQLKDAVIHCFTGDKKSLFGYLDLDLYIGITGWVCDERRGTELQELVHNIPLDRLMIETDAPYLLPRNMTKKPKDRTNRPAFLPWILLQISQCYQKEALELARRTRENSAYFFNLPPESLNDQTKEKIHDPVSDFYRL
ncbi:TatD family hydrolase [Oceanospirillum sediminis]|uniref:TatD family hydrolase n=1 Tax=Oceanospirillum sediminis TaxID=2760088 RepID=A0A839INH2_9GAMM|nr:TatD family hydrolase [Oceanospirillum sediminis]MBB1486062.1 TatD family hydrolase [Oceanospirillum sediminis]